MGLLQDTLSRLWADKKEEVIHECIIEVFKSSYDVDYVHKKRGKSSENGIDIKLRNDKENIIFQVKKSPSIGDIDQLRLFSSQDATNRIYVYINEPSTDFKRGMFSKGIKNKVTFWNVQKLHEELIKNGSIEYSRYLIQNTQLLRNIAKVLQILIECRSVKPQNTIDTDEYEMLWKMKDETVKLNASLKLCHEHWREVLGRKTTESEVERLSIVEEILKDIYFVDAIIFKLFYRYEECKENYPGILGCMWKKCKRRSNWGTFTRRFESKMGDTEMYSNVVDWLLPNSDREVGFYTNLMEMLETLSDKAQDIEDGVDFVFEDLNKK